MPMIGIAIFLGAATTVVAIHSGEGEPATKEQVTSDSHGVEVNDGVVVDRLHSEMALKQTGEK